MLLQRVPALTVTYSQDLMLESIRSLVGAGGMAAPGKVLVAAFDVPHTAPGRLVGVTAPMPVTPR